MAENVKGGDVHLRKREVGPTKTQTFTFSCNTCSNPFEVITHVEEEGETVNKTAEVVSGSCGLSPPCGNKHSINQALNMSRNASG